MAEKGILDWGEIGLRVGLEIHQQLATRRKLFCHCPATLAGDSVEEDVFPRRLRPTRSEIGEIDPAALFEWRKGRRYRYHAPLGHSCLVEADEEPPHELDRESLATALAFAAAVNATPVDEVYVMRKTVIDGSNTSGFQRTALIALGGSVSVEGKKYGIQTVVLEEDAARKLDEKPGETGYRLDRLGIPLVEVATAPDITSPEEARQVALHIGMLFRLMGKARRGIGSIRQDVNVSIRGGAITEIKGVQTLDLIPKVIELEARRQLELLKLRDELARKGLRGRLDPRIYDVTEAFSGTGSKIIKRTLRRGGRVLALRLPGFKGVLGRELVPGRRVGTELADYARFWAGVGGLFHSDELPGYGITGDEVETIYRMLNLDPASDAFVLVADQRESAEKALEAVYNRVEQLFEGVPEETRQSLPDGTTRFLRPRPGSARMYPETDIPPVPITAGLLREAEKLKPPSPEELANRLVEEHGLNRQLAWQIIRSPYLDEYLQAAREHPGLPRTWLASLYTNLLPMLAREGVPVENLTPEHRLEVVRLIAEGRAAKEAAEPLLRGLAEEPKESPERLLEKLGLSTLPREKIEEIIEQIIEENIDAVKSRGMKAMGLIMGRAMARLRGKADGKTVSEIVKKKLQEKLS